jgi:hypothetical protein
MVQIEIKFFYPHSTISLFLKWSVFEFQGDYRYGRCKIGFNPIVHIYFVSLSENVSPAFISS